MFKIIMTLIFLLSGVQAFASQEDIGCVLEAPGVGWPLSHHVLLIDGKADFSVDLDATRPDILKKYGFNLSGLMAFVKVRDKEVNILVRELVAHKYNDRTDWEYRSLPSTSVQDKNFYSRVESAFERDGNKFKIMCAITPAEDWAKIGVM